MNLSRQIFTQAHEITRAVRQNGDSYQVVFSAALSLAYDCRYLVLISNNRQLWAVVDGRGNVIEQGQWNRRERNTAEQRAEQYNASLITKPTTTRKAGSRYIELVSRAAGLNTGKPWICTGYNVDQYSLHPSFEGELVCYVYPS